MVLLLLLFKEKKKGGGEEISKGPPNGYIWLKFSFSRGNFLGLLCLTGKITALFFR